MIPPLHNNRINSSFLVVAVSSMLGWPAHAASSPPSAVTFLASPANETVSVGPQVLETDWDGTLEIQECVPRQMQLPAQTEMALHATLLVRVPAGIGSAVLISPDGFALTAAHVIGDANKVEVVADGGDEFEARVVRVDDRQDVALLKIPQLGSAPCLHPAAQRTPVGSDIYVLGSPGGEELSFSVAKGIVSGYRNFDGVRFVQLDASVNPGNSGGPVVDDRGEIVGLASWKVSHVAMEGLAFAVPVATALEALEVLLTDSTSSNWASSGGRRKAALEPASKSEGPEPLVGEAPSLKGIVHEPQDTRRRRTRASLITAGIVGFSLGTIAVAGTAAAYYSRRFDTRTFGDPGFPESTWRTLVGVNSVGWAAALCGAALFVTGTALPKTPKNAQPSVSFVLTPTGISAAGEF